MAYSVIKYSLLRYYIFSNICHLISLQFSTSSPYRLTPLPLSPQRDKNYVIKTNIDSNNNVYYYIKAFYYIIVAREKMYLFSLSLQIAK